MSTHSDRRGVSPHPRGPAGAPFTRGEEARTGGGRACLAEVEAIRRPWRGRRLARSRREEAVQDEDCICFYNVVFPVMHPSWTLLGFNDADLIEYYRIPYRYPTIL